MKKPKSAAKLAAEASDKLDRIEDVYHSALIECQRKFNEKRAEVWASLSDEAAAKLRGLRAEIVEVIDDVYGGKSDEQHDRLFGAADEPTHLRDVMP